MEGWRFLLKLINGSVKINVGEGDGGGGGGGLLILAMNERQHVNI